MRVRNWLSQLSIYLRVAQENFSVPVSLKDRAVGWVASEIAAWIEGQIAERPSFPGDQDRRMKKATRLLAIRDQTTFVKS
jgi:hypothetical protein